jgi:glycopeptide antibiotics resistance protein
MWVGVILIIVVPWYRWEGHTHWANVEWIPFSRPSHHVRDAVLNTLFYVPFGFLYRRMMPGHTLGAVVAAFLLSSATELTQVYGHGRFPSSTDVLSNSIGAWIGMRWYEARLDRATDAGADLC